MKYWCSCYWQMDTTGPDWAACLAKMIRPIRMCRRRCAIVVPSIADPGVRPCAGCTRRLHKIFPELTPCLSMLQGLCPPGGRQRDRQPICSRCSSRAPTAIAWRRPNVPFVNARARRSMGLLIHGSDDVWQPLRGDAAGTPASRSGSRASPPCVGCDTWRAQTSPLIGVIQPDNLAYDITIMFCR